MRHVADSPQWRNIDNIFEDFGDEIRNIRFGLSSDRINPFGSMSSHVTPQKLELTKTFVIQRNMVHKYTPRHDSCQIQHGETNNTNIQLPIGN